MDLLNDLEKLRKKRGEQWASKEILSQVKKVQKTRSKLIGEIQENQQKILDLDERIWASQRDLEIHRPRAEELNTFLEKIRESMEALKQSKDDLKK